jgi:hypothetical protein
VWPVVVVVAHVDSEYSLPGLRRRGARPAGDAVGRLGRLPELSGPCPLGEGDRPGLDGESHVPGELPGLRRGDPVAGGRAGRGPPRALRAAIPAHVGLQRLRGESRTRTPTTDPPLSRRPPSEWASVRLVPAAPLLRSRFFASISSRGHLDRPGRGGDVVPGGACPAGTNRRRSRTRPLAISLAGRPSGRAVCCRGERSVSVQHTAREADAVLRPSVPSTQGSPLSACIRSLQ